MSCVVSDQIRTVMNKLLADPRVQKAFAFVDADQNDKIAELKEMTLLHGEPFREKELRSPMCKAKLEKYGLADCFIDNEGNAFGRLGGKKARPLVAIEAHLDTVFSKDTPLAITEKDGRLYCPGVCDDTAGLANLFSALRAIRHAGLKPVGSIFAGGTVGEEGLGDLRGIKALLRENKDIDALLSIEPGNVADISLVGLGTRRYEFVFKGPGGHSWRAYGLPNPVHAMGRAIGKIAAVKLPENPKTTCTVAMVSGGISINGIATESRMKLDMRSGAQENLDKLIQTMLALVEEGVAEENEFARNSGKEITLETILVGDRPSGVQGEDSLMAQLGWAANEALGNTPKFFEPISGNNVGGLSVGIPALVVRLGGSFGPLHTLEEWFGPEGSQMGVKYTLLMLFALAGLEGVTEPLAPVCKR